MRAPLAFPALAFKRIHCLSSVTAADLDLPPGTDTTTLHTINSCIVKLGKVTKACKVYRGVAGGVLPAEFWHEDQHLVRGGVEFSFMSTTKSFDVAMDYARAKGSSSVSIVFEMIQGLVDRGADLKWLSQYPHEEEVRRVEIAP